MQYELHESCQDQWRRLTICLPKDRIYLLLIFIPLLIRAININGYQRQGIKIASVVIKLSFKVFIYCADRRFRFFCSFLPFLENVSYEPECFEFF